MLLLHNSLVALSSLILVLDDVLLLELPHALNLIQIDNEALIVSMKRLDTLSAENVQMVRAVEVLDTFRMYLAELLRKALFVLILKVETCARQDRVFLDNFVQDVNVQRKALGAFQPLDQLAADGASHSVLVVQLLDAVRAQSMAAVDQYARDALTHVVLECAELADVEAAGLVV